MKALFKTYLFLFLAFLFFSQNKVYAIQNFVNTEKEIDFKAVMSDVLANATNYHFSNKPDSALIYYKQYLNIALESSDKNAGVYAYTKLAEFYRYIGRLNKAKESIEEGLKLNNSNSIKDEKLAYLYNRYAAIEASFNGLSETSISLSYSAIKYALACGDSLRYASSLKEIGAVYEKRQNDSCIFFYEKAYKVYQTLGDSSELPGLLINFARYYHHAKQYKKSLEYSYKGIREFENISVDLEKCDLYFYNEESNQFLGNAMEAYRSLQKYYYYDIKQREIRNSKALADVQAKYDFASKELIISDQEIALASEIKKGFYLFISLLLISALAILGFVFYKKTQTKNKLLEKLSKQNAFLTEEANHRIKNNLQLILSLIYREQKKEKVQKEITGLKELATKISSIASLHQQLYTKDEKDKIEFNAFVNDIVNNIKPMFSDYNVKVYMRIEQILINNSLASYLGILLSELSTNSLKHAFNNTAKPTIIIKFEAETNVYQLTYKDNGGGYDVDKRLVLVDLLCQQMKATYSINSSKGFEINVRIKK